jgi:alkylhydroperoxidase family enzyme
MVKAVLDDYRTAAIGEPERALFAFIARMNHESHTLTSEDVAAVVAAGWSEEAVYDAITVCALFNFYNKWIDATGVGDMPAAAYVASGQRLASRGYVPAPPAEHGAMR